MRSNFTSWSDALLLWCNENSIVGFKLIYMIAIIILAGIREKMEYNDIPKAFKGTAIVLVAAALMSIAFMGFTGMSI